MKKKKCYCDEEIAAAMVKAGTVSGAASMLGCNPRTIRARQKDYRFCALLASLRADTLSAEMDALKDAASSAVQVLQTIAEDTEATNRDRIKAAQILLEYGYRIQRMQTDAEQTAFSRMCEADEKQKSLEARAVFDVLGALTDVITEADSDEDEDED